MSLFGRGRDTRLRKDRTGANPLTVGLVVLAVVAIGVFFGFTKHIPFTHGYQVKAVFETANSLRPNSPVRIAGVNVGKVKKIQRYDGSDAAVVTMEITKQGLPIHKDATMTVRPRIFLEGNFFVDLSPGTPGTPTISSGDTIGMTQTSASSSATASQVWRSRATPSSPMISPAIWKPVTWSRPSGAVMQFLKNPVRIA